MDVVQRYVNQLRAAWAGLNGGYRFLVLALLTAIAVASGAYYFLAISSDYQTAFSGLTPEDAGAIVAHLESAGIPHRLEAHGTAILVPSDRVAKAVVDVAAQGLTPKAGGKGMELWDKASFGMTPFVQNVTQVRALQGELARHIMQLQPVSKASVLIARPDRTTFAYRDQQPTTASVVLTLKPGASFNRALADSIVSVVARSVEGLQAENVTVTDSTGRLLSDPHAHEHAPLSGRELDVTLQWEKYLGEKAEKLLQNTLGSGRAHVCVSAKLNFEKVKEIQEKYSAEDRAVVSELIKTTETGGSATDARGIAGATANIGRGAGGSAGASGQRSKEENTETRYVPSHTTRESENSASAIQRLSVAATVDLIPPEGEAAGDKPALTVKDVEDLIKQAVGFQTGRDAITVSSVRLLQPPATPPEAGSDALDWLDQAQVYVRLVRNAMVMTAVVFLALTVLLVVRRFLAALANEAGATTSARSEGGSAYGVHGSAPIEFGGHARPAEQERFVELARDNPQQVARMLSTLGGTNGRA